MQRLFALTFCVCPSLASASYANIYGICNQYHIPVYFTNTECSGNNCVASAHGHCDAKRAFIPACENAGDYPNHHMFLSSQNMDPTVEWAFWKSDGKGEIQGGTDYGTATDMTKELSKGQWNVVISPVGKVTLYASSDPNDCPVAPPQCSKITKKSGSWQYVQSVNSHQSITLKHGVTRSYTNTDTQSWSESVEVSVSDTFEAFGTEGSVTVSSTTSKSVSKSYSKTFSETNEQDFTDTFDAGTIWQWQWTFQDECGTSTVKGTDLVRTNGTYQPPCCLPGFAKDPMNYAGDCAANFGDKVYNLCNKMEDGIVLT